MRKRYKNSFRIKLLENIQSTNAEVILRADLNDLGAPRQISRGLKALLEDGELIKFGYGVYVKAEKTPYSDEPILSIPIAEACVETLQRLGIQWELGKAIRDYNEGKTQQVPVKFIVRLKDRFRGKLGAGRRAIRFEGNINAR